MEIPRPKINPNREIQEAIRALSVRMKKNGGSAESIDDIIAQLAMLSDKLSMLQGNTTETVESLYNLITQLQDQVNNMQYGEYVIPNEMQIYIDRISVVNAIDALTHQANYQSVNTSDLMITIYKDSLPLQTIDLIRPGRAFAFMHMINYMPYYQLAICTNIGDSTIQFKQATSEVTNAIGTVKILRSNTYIRNTLLTRTLSDNSMVHLFTQQYLGRQVYGKDIYIYDTAPTGAQQGDIWFDLSTLTRR